MHSAPKARQVAVVGATLGITFHWIPDSWWRHTAGLFEALDRTWSYGLSLTLLGVAMTIWSPRVFGLTWSQTWRERRLVARVGGAMFLIAAIGMLFIRVPFFGQSAAFFLCIPLAEELLFRGFVFAALDDAFPRRLTIARFRFAAATLLSSVAFGLWHLGGLQWPSDGFTVFQVTYTTIAGFLFALMRERTGSLIAPWIVHALVNAWAVNVPGFWAMK